MGIRADAETAFQIRKNDLDAGTRFELGIDNFGFFRFGRSRSVKADEVFGAYSAFPYSSVFLRSRAFACVRRVFHNGIARGLENGRAQRGAGDSGLREHGAVSGT